MKVSTVRLTEGFGPINVVTTDSTICVVGLASHKIRFYRKDNYQVSEEITLPFSPATAAVSPDGKVWVLAAQGNKIVTINPQNRKDIVFSSIQEQEEGKLNGSRVLSAMLFMGNNEAVISDEKNAEILVVDKNSKQDFLALLMLGVAKHMAGNKAARLRNLHAVPTTDTPTLTVRLWATVGSRAATASIAAALSRR